ncbi:MAG: PrgI family protein [Enterococcus sp.]|uniref:PrgI family protein n=1 Tax=Candidatus Enterococcus wittei TaxID=1987383 RepID=UPI001FCE5BF2|nr:PrgI family protein [Enterococcus sp. 10A9_DIV0425]
MSLLALEVAVRKEIKEYQEKIFFGFSLRQLIAISCTLSIVVPIVVFNHLIWKRSIDDLGFVLMVFSGPILSIGWIRKNQLPMEKYLQVRWRYLKLAKSYPYQSCQLEEFYETMGKRSRKESRRREYGN